MRWWHDEVYAAEWGAEVGQIIGHACVYGGSIHRMLSEHWRWCWPPPPTSEGLPCFWAADLSSQGESLGRTNAGGTCMQVYE